jgi:hypothetical protein
MDLLVVQVEISLRCHNEEHNNGGSKKHVGKITLVFDITEAEDGHKHCKRQEYGAEIRQPVKNKSRFDAIGHGNAQVAKIHSKDRQKQQQHPPVFITLKNSVSRKHNECQRCCNKIKRLHTQVLVSDQFATGKEWEAER